jgi:hypothetical protein
MLILQQETEITVKTLIAAFALASIVAPSAIAKTEKIAPTFIEPSNLVMCGRVVLADPDPRIRAELLRDCTHHNGAN